MFVTQKLYFQYRTIKTIYMFGTSMEMKEAMFRLTLAKLCHSGPLCHNNNLLDLFNRLRPEPNCKVLHSENDFNHWLIISHIDGILQ